MRQRIMSNIYAALSSKKTDVFYIHSFPDNNFFMDI